LTLAACQASRLKLEAFFFLLFRISLICRLQLEAWGL